MTLRCRGNRLAAAQYLQIATKVSSIFDFNVLTAFHGCLLHGKVVKQTRLVVGNGHGEHLPVRTFVTNAVFTIHSPLDAPIEIIARFQKETTLFTESRSKDTAVECQIELNAPRIIHKY
jgi:hypothetical protein